MAKLKLRKIADISVRSALTLVIVSLGDALIGAFPNIADAVFPEAWY